MKDSDFIRLDMAVTHGDAICLICEQHVRLCICQVAELPVLKGSFIECEPTLGYAPALRFQFPVPDRKALKRMLGGKA